VLLDQAGTGDMLSLADQLRDFIGRHYLDHGPRAHNWHRLADEIDRLEGTKPGQSSGLDIDKVHADTMTAPENEHP
jgi:hypothetical protein